MTTATETQPTKLFFDCGHAELHPLDATEYRHVSVGGQCTACRERASSNAITLSSFRVEYRAPRYEDGRVLYDGYCAILADDAEHGGAEVRVFDVPDADEGQRTVAQFACEAMNQHERLVEALRNILADCETAQERRTTADWDFATCQAIEYAREALAEVDATTTTKEQINGTR